MATAYRLLCSSIVIVLVSASAAAAELVVAAGGPMRAGIPACPQGAAMTGFDAATGRLLCETGFVGANNSSWIGAEAVSAAPTAGLGSIWPPTSLVGVAHSYGGTPMHWCNLGRVMTGFSAATNRFLCSSFAGGTSTTTRRLFVMQPIRRSGLPACPRGSALAGIHLGNGSFLCAELAHCRENAHCSVSQACETRSVPPLHQEDQVGGGLGICRPSGLLSLRNQGGCFGGSAGWLTDRSGNTVDFTASDSFDNDAARSLRLTRVSAGTIIRVFDRSDGRRSDDYSEILVRSTTTATYCVPTFQFANAEFSDSFITARYNRRDNLDGKVSRVEVQTAIIGSAGKCLDVNQNDNTVQLFPCHMGPNQSWMQQTDGTIKGLNNACLEARQSDVNAWRAGGPRSALLQIAGCTGAANQQWSRTTSQEIRMFSDMCMDIRGGGNADHTPIQIYPCHGGANQRWRASL